jgi:uncharacterized protein YbjT (DUF2867 family)
MNDKTALLLGATGLVGSECLKRLVTDDYYSRIIVLTRRALADAVGSTKIESHVIDFNRISDYRDLLKASHVFCTLGSTIRKAGSKEQFYKVDFTYVHDIAGLCAEQGTEHFLVVSAMGADARSRIFYSRVKGELEEALQRLPFRGLSVFRPSLILGDRKEYRLKEEISKRVMSVFAFAIPGKYKPVEAADIAKAMLKTAHAGPAGLRIYESDEIRRMAR